jgi:hypothetical protein
MIAVELLVVIFELLSFRILTLAEEQAEGIVVVYLCNHTIVIGNHAVVALMILQIIAIIHLPSVRFNISVIYKNPV